MDNRRPLISWLGAIWGVSGVVLLIGSAIYRLTPLAIDSFSYAWSLHHWLFLAFVLIFMAYFEGYRAFQQGFSPRVAARARYLRDRPEPFHAILAPLFCMAYFHAPRKRMITSLSVTAGIIILVILVRLLPQPWRGIIDGGVVVGLTWGLVSLAIFTAKALSGKLFPYEPEVPEAGTQE